MAENINWFFDVYTKFKLHFYKEVFSRFQGREASLTITESYCIDIIYSLGTPTVQEFADLAGISASNATYKVNTLIKKGYLEKVQSMKDRRVYFLKTTDRYKNYLKLSTDYASEVMDRARKRFSKKEIDIFNNVLMVIATELTPEVDIPIHALEHKNGKED